VIFGLKIPKPSGNPALVIQKTMMQVDRSNLQKTLTTSPRTFVKNLKIFWPNNLAQKMVLITQNTAKLCICKKWSITMVLNTNAKFFAENWQKIADNSDQV
jgi:hypothetical protein